MGAQYRDRDHRGLAQAVGDLPPQLRRQPRGVDRRMRFDPVVGSGTGPFEVPALVGSAQPPADHLLGTEQPKIGGVVIGGDQVELADRSFDHHFGQ